MPRSDQSASTTVAVNEGHVVLTLWEGEAARSDVAFQRRFSREEAARLARQLIRESDALPPKTSGAGS